MEWGAALPSWISDSGAGYWSSQWSNHSKSTSSKLDVVPFSLTVHRDRFIIPKKVATDAPFCFPLSHLELPASFSLMMLGGRLPALQSPVEPGSSVLSSILDELRLLDMVWHLY